jgi:DNA (cytosine-5)-methyltransferase 1
MKKHIVYLDLFSGLGSFAKGRLTAGFTFNNHYFSEIDKYAISNYRYNFKNAKYAGEINQINKKIIQKPDLITFGSPCQNLSLAGRREGLKGQKSSLFFKAIELIDWYRPPVFIFENVAGLFSSNKGKDFEIVLKTIAELGVYECQWQLINTTWFLPQNRERIYLVGCLGKERGKTVFPLNVPYEKDKPYQKKVMVVDATSNSQTGRIYTSDRFSPTLMAADAFSNGYVVSDDRIRRLTPIEGERLQGLPDNWTKYGIFDHQVTKISDSQRYQLIGNAVSRPIVTEIGKCLLKVPTLLGGEGLKTPSRTIQLQEEAKVLFNQLKAFRAYSDRKKG